MPNARVGAGAGGRARVRACEYVRKHSGRVHLAQARAADVDPDAAALREEVRAKDAVADCEACRGGTRGEGKMKGVELRSSSVGAASASCLVWRKQAVI